MILTLATTATTSIGWFRAATSLAAVLVWPILVVILVIVFREQLVALLRSMSELRGPGFTAKFDRSGREVGAYLEYERAATPPAPTESVEAIERRPPLTEFYEKRADENPLNALLEAYIAIERWYDKALTDRDIDNHEGFQKLSVTEMAGIAVERDLLPASTLNLIDGLTVMRSLALTAPPERVTPDQAREFLALADGALLSLDTELRKSVK